MPHWKLKWALHRLIAASGRSARLSAALQALTGSTAVEEDRVLAKLEHTARHLRAHRRHSPEPRTDLHVLDLGTGWLPVVPIALALAGASSVRTVDIDPLLDEERTRATMRLVADLADRGAFPDDLPHHDERLRALRAAAELPSPATPAGLLAPLGIEVIVDDVRSLPLEDGSIDLIVSVDTIFAIDEDVLTGILATFRRLLRSSGVASIRAELSDLYSYFDDRISPLHFLRYTPAEWRRYDSPITPQNRLRLPDYRRLFTAAGLPVVEEDSTPIDPSDAADVPLAPEFRGIDDADLLVQRSWLVAVPGDVGR